MINHRGSRIGVPKKPYVVSTQYFMVYYIKVMYESKHTNVFDHIFMYACLCY